MTIALLSALVATLMIAEHAPTAPVEGVAERVAFLGAFVAALCAAAVAGANSAAATWCECSTNAARRLWFATYRWFRRGHLAAWTLLGPLSIYISSWSQIVRGNWGCNAVFLADEILILLPLIAPLIFAWFAFALVDRMLIAERGGEAPSRWAILSLNVRHHLGLFLLPTLFALAIGELGQGVDVPPWLAYGGTFATLLFLFPLLLRHIWSTETLPAGELRDELKEIAEFAGMRVQDFLVWRTAGSLINAAVVGLAGFFRYVLFTDSLLRHFSRRDIHAVLLHEAGHVRRRHLPLRCLLIGLPLATWFVASTTVDHAGSMLASVEETSNMNAGLFELLLPPLLIAGYCLASLCWLSRLLEHDADLWAYQTASGRADLGGDAYVLMLQKLAALSGAERGRASWLHPSIDKRVALIRAAADNPRHLRRFRSTLRITIAAFLALALAPLTLLMVS